jgi:hypothetical protein
MQYYARQEIHSMSVRNFSILLSVLTVALAYPSLLLANDGDRVHVLQDVTVNSDERVGDVVCVFCSVRMAGTTSGDVVAVFGSAIVDGTVNGDVVSVGGGIKLGEDASVSGDTVGIGRGVFRHPNAVVKGEVVSQAGPIILVGLVVIPLLPVILVVSLIVWLLRRNRYPAPTQVAYRR